MGLVSLKYGRFRIVPSVRNRKVAYLVMTGNILISVHPSKGKAAMEAMKLNNAEKRAIAGIKKVARKAEKAGLSFADLLLERGTLKSKIKRRIRKRITRHGQKLDPKLLKAAARRKIKERLKKLKK